jgi:carotenoid cleavage dioxygenase
MQKNLIIGFLPWILYFIFLGPSRTEMDIAIIVGLIAFLVTGLTSLKKGYILNWTTLLFFLFMFVTVVWLNNDWIAEHAIFISNALLAVVTWGSILFGVPFTIQYAKQQVPPSKWKNPIFIYINQVLSIAWGITFTLSALSYYANSSIIYRLLQEVPLIITILLTLYFPKWYRLKKMQHPSVKT